MAINKQEIIEQWTNKGAEYCANRLWQCRNELKKERERRRLYFKEAHVFTAKHALVEDVMKANQNLKTALEENGITPVKLRLYYLFREHDEDCEECCFEFCDVCAEKEEVEYIESLAFYTYKISDGFIHGIVSNLSERFIDCYKIVDDRTGEVIYEMEQEEMADAE